MADRFEDEYDVAWRVREDLEWRARAAERLRRRQDDPRTQERSLSNWQDDSEPEKSDDG